MDLKKLLWDNPILVKHARSRLRRRDLFPSIVAVVIVAGCIVWGASATNNIKNGVGFVALLAFQSALLFLVGTSSVASSIAHARDSGMMDFHRISPQPPLSTALGFLLGGPIREWLLFACTIPFSLFFVTKGSPPMKSWLLIFITTLTTTLLYHCVAATAGMLVAKPRNVGAMVIVSLWFLYCAALAGLKVAFLTLIPVACHGVLPRSSLWLDYVHRGLPTFYRSRWDPFWLSLLHQVPLIVFLFIACVRKMRHGGVLAYSKPLAVVFHVVLAFLIAGDLWGMRLDPGTAHVVGTYLLTTAALLLTLAITPKAGQFATGVRRARKAGLLNQPPWSDLSSNWVAVLAFAALVEIGSALCGGGTEGKMTETTITSVLVGACTVVYFGAARQCFELRFARSSGPYFLLFLFFVWIVPTLIGAIMAPWDLQWSKVVGAISPLAGIGFASDPDMPSAVAWVAIASSILLTLVFLIWQIGLERHATEAALLPPGQVTPSASSGVA